jgi:hypothetical protein
MAKFLVWVCILCNTVTATRLEFECICLLSTERVCIFRLTCQMLGNSALYCLFIPMCGDLIISVGYKSILPTRIYVLMSDPVFVAGTAVGVVSVSTCD